MLAWFFSQTLKGNFNRSITETKVCSDDSHKNPDILMREDSIWRGVQITQLLFTRYEERKDISARMNQSLADAIAMAITLPFPLIVNIQPTAQKGEIPMEDVRKKGRLQSELVDFIINMLKKNQAILETSKTPLYFNVDKPKLAPHFRHIALNPIPKHATSRFPSNGNISVNYDQDDVAFNDNDIAAAIDEVFDKKNNGNSEILLIWADNFGLNFHERKIVEGLYSKFSNSSFEEVYFMTFENYKSRITETLNLWPIKAIKNYIRTPVH